MIRIVVVAVMIFLGSCSSSALPEPPPSRQKPAKQTPDQPAADDPAQRWSTDPWDADPSTVSPPKDDDETPDDDEEEPDLDPDLPPPPETSGGTGGESGLHELRYAASNGEDSTYKIDVPADALTGKVYGLHVHLHGDGGGGYRDFPNKEPAHDLIGVTVKAPNTSLTWGRFSGVPHAKYVHDLIQNEILKKYDIDINRIYFSGVSGGAYFLTGNFVPTYGHLYKTGAFVICGGERPRVPIADNSVLTDFRLYWQVTAGERDDILQSVQASIARYKQLLDNYLVGNPIPDFDPKSVQDSEIDGPGGHCEFDGLDYTGGIQSIINRKFDVVLKP